MKTIYTAAIAIVATMGIAAAETPGDPALFGLVEAGNPGTTSAQETVVDLSRATGFMSNPADGWGGILGDPASGSVRHHQ